MQSFTEEFRNKALKLGISLASPKTIKNNIRSLHSYMRHSLLLFEPTTIDAASVKLIHLEKKGMNDKEE